MDDDVEEPKKRPMEPNLRKCMPFVTPRAALLEEAMGLGMVLVLVLGAAPLQFVRCRCFERGVFLRVLLWLAS